MKYKQKTFTVPASAPSKVECPDGKHPMLDVRGKCIRCGVTVEPDGRTE